jgi:hypothetical protein
VRPDKEIAKDIDLGAPLSPVTYKRFAGEKQGWARGLNHDQAEVIEGLIQGFHRREGQRKFGVVLAERAGFEPALGYYPKHAFQACDLNHSSISPEDREF